MATSNQVDEALFGPNLAPIIKAAIIQALSDPCVSASLRSAFHCKSKKQQNQKQ